MRRIDRIIGQPGLRVITGIIAIQNILIALGYIILPEPFKANSQLVIALDEFVMPHIWGGVLFLSAIGLLYGTIRNHRLAVSKTSFLMALTWLFALGAYLTLWPDTWVQIVTTALPQIAFAVFVRFRSTLGSSETIMRWT